jgi:curved DNA-binding protein CbpA
MNWEEACRVLGIQPGATPEEIKTQYLYKANLLHPDKTVNCPEKVKLQAEEELKQVNSAYAVLQNPSNNRLSQQPKLAVSLPTSASPASAGAEKTRLSG